MNDDVKRYRIICLIATGCSNKEAADQAGVSLSTIERLKRDADFKSELHQAINQVYRNGLLRLALGMDKAAEELLKILESPDTSDRVRLRAIEILFAQAGNLDTLVLGERINRLEQEVAARRARPIYLDQEQEEESSN